jgi:hypothetical protein
LTEAFGTTSIALVTNHELSEENKIFICEIRKKLYDFCKKADQDEGLTVDGYHLSELLELLHRAFTDTYVIKYIMENQINGTLTPRMRCWPK